MKLTMRPYQTENDFWRIRAFLRQVMQLNGVREKSWHVARLDYWRWHVVANCQAPDSIEDVVFLWETADGRDGGCAESRRRRAKPTCRCIPICARRSWRRR